MSKARQARKYLKAARNLISDPKRWTQSFLALNKDGVPVEPNSPTASCWCAIGALAKIEGVPVPLGPGKSYLYRSVKELFNMWSLVAVNDTLGHAAVLKAYDRAIEMTSLRYRVKEFIKKIRRVL